MSGYENIMGGKLRLKGKALDVKAGGGLKKKNKKKKQQKLFDQFSEVNHNELSAGGSTEMTEEDVKKHDYDDDDDDAKKSSLTEGGVTSGSVVSSYEDAHLTPAERRYMEQKEKIDVHRLAKIANKSHRDRIQDFNQYLANMSEHYDIPKVGPG